MELRYVHNGRGANTVPSKQNGNEEQEDDQRNGNMSKSNLQQMNQKQNQKTYNNNNNNQKKTGNKFLDQNNQQNQVMQPYAPPSTAEPSSNKNKKQQVNGQNQNPTHAKPNNKKKFPSGNEQNGRGNQPNSFKQNQLKTNQNHDSDEFSNGDKNIKGNSNMFQAGKMSGAGNPRFNKNQRQQNNEEDHYYEDDDDEEEEEKMNGKQQGNKKQIDPNGHKPNTHIDSQYDRSKVEHYFNEKDTKFSKEKRYNFKTDKEGVHQGSRNTNHRQNVNKITSIRQEEEEFQINETLIHLGLKDEIDEGILMDSNKAINLYEWNDLYKLFKIAEKKTSQTYLRMNEQAQTKVLFDKEQMDSTEFKFLQQTAKLMILQNLEMASEKKIDQRLWDVYKKKIEYSKNMKLFTANPNDQMHIFDSKIVFLRNLLKDIIDLYKIEFCSELTESNQKRRIIANLFCYFGELIEHKEKVSRLSTPANQKNMQFAAGQYLKAISIYPFCGKFFYLLATLVHMNDDQFCAIYWCIRAVCSEQAYPCTENLQEFLEINRQKCSKFQNEHNTYGYINDEDQLKVFILHFLSYLNIVYTKINIDSFKMHSDMFEHFRKHIIYLQKLQANNENEKTTLFNEQLLLEYIVMMIVFTMSKFSSYIASDLTIERLKNDQMASQGMDYSYALLTMIIDLYISSDFIGFLDLVFPIIAYFTSNQIIAEFLFTKYPAFNQLFNRLLQKIRNQFAPFASRMSRANYEELCDKFITDIEIKMIGFSPFNSYFENSKDTFQILSDETLLYPLKLFTLLDKLPRINSFKISLEQDVLKEPPSQLSNVHSEDFFFLKKSSPSKELQDRVHQKQQLIVVDGMNVAIRHGNSGFSSLGLKIVVDFWHNHQTSVNVFLPDFCFSTEQIEKKRKKYIKDKQNDRLKTLPDNVEILLQLKEQGFATGIPNWNYDDSYMIEYARKKDAFVLTNDRYNDHIQKYRNDPKTMEIVRQWIRNNCMSFTFIKDELIPDPDFISKRTTICLGGPSDIKTQ